MRFGFSFVYTKYFYHVIVYVYDTEAKVIKFSYVLSLHISLASSFILQTINLCAPENFVPQRQHQVSENNKVKFTCLIWMRCFDSLSAEHVSASDGWEYAMYGT